MRVAHCPGTAPVTSLTGWEAHLAQTEGGQRTRGRRHCKFIRAKSPIPDSTQNESLVKRTLILVVGLFRWAHGRELSQGCFTSRQHSSRLTVTTSQGRHQCGSVGGGAHAEWQVGTIRTANILMSLFRLARSDLDGKQWVTLCSDSPPRITRFICSLFDSFPALTVRDRHPDRFDIHSLARTRYTTSQ